MRQGRVQRYCSRARGADRCAEPRSTSTHPESALPAEAESGAAKLVGRRDECEALDPLIADALAGASRAIVLRGKPVWARARCWAICPTASPAGVSRRAVGVESEMELAYSGLHQLCAPMLDHLERLPAPAARGARDGVRPKRRACTRPVPGRTRHADAPRRGRRGATARLHRRRRTVARSGLRADHRLRRPPALRRAGSARVRGAHRRRRRRPRRAPELSIEGLGDSDARALLLGSVHGPLDAAVCDQIVAESHGNPLALLELPRTWSTADLAGGFGFPDSQHVTGKIEQSYVRRILQLPSDTRLLVLAAAAEPAGRPGAAPSRRRDARRRHVRGRPCRRCGAAPGRGAEWSSRTHSSDPPPTGQPPPTTAAACIAPSPRRPTPTTDPDRRAWHRARAAPGPDEGSRRRARAVRGPRAGARRPRCGSRVPAGVDRADARSCAAGRPRARGREREPARRGIRLGSSGCSPPRRPAGPTSSSARRPTCYVDRSRSSPAPDARLLDCCSPRPNGSSRSTFHSRARRTSTHGARRCSRAGSHTANSLTSPAPPRRHRSPPTRAAPDLLLDGLATLITKGRAAATPTLRRAVDAFRDEEVSVEKGLQWGVLASTASVILWDFDSWQAIITRAGRSRSRRRCVRPVVDRTPRTGDRRHLVRELRCGRCADHGGRGRHRGDPNPDRAVRGRSARRLSADGKPRPRRSSRATIENATAGGEGLGVQFAGWARAVLYNGLGRYDEALEAAREASTDTPELFIAAWALPELIEAAARTGRADLASDALERLTEAVSASDSEWGLGVAVRSRALLSEGERADGFYREALARLSRTRLRPELARAHLLYGEWLRRAGRRVDAREQLRSRTTC